MEFDVSNFYDAPSAKLEGKLALLSNSIGELFRLIKDQDFTKLCKVSMNADGVPFNDEEGNFYKYAYHTDAFDNIKSTSESILNELAKLSDDDSVNAILNILNNIPGHIVRDIVHKLLEWDYVISELVDSGFVHTDDTDSIVNLVNNDADMSESVFQYYKDNSLCNDEKAKLIKGWIKELL